MNLHGVMKPVQLIIEFIMHSQQTFMSCFIVPLELFLPASLLTYECKGAKQNTHCRLNRWHALQLLGSHFAVPSDVAGTHCH